MSTTFYVSASGLDTNPGTRARPWRSVARVNAAELRPGDSVLFHDEATFEGTLVPGSSGTAALPVVYGSYPSGRATIRGGGGPGIHVRRPLAHVVFKDLVLGGNWSTATETGDGAIGVHFENPHHYKRIVLENLDVSGFGSHGILVWGSSEEMVIRGCRSHHNRHDGIVLRPQNWISIAHKNVTVANCWAHHNTGLSTLKSEHSGSGILLGGVDEGRVEDCIAHHNGLRCASESGGPVGIWTWMSNRVTMSNCESHHNGNAGANDGGGFDIDGGCTRCVVERCYSHDNEGPGLLVAAYPGAPVMSDNTLRNNVSLYDCVKASRGGSVVVWNGQGDASAVQRTTFRRNVIVGLNQVLHTFGAQTTETVIEGNRFYIPTKKLILTLPVTGPGFLLDGNEYVSCVQKGLDFSVFNELRGGFAAFRKQKFERKGRLVKVKILPRGMPRLAPTIENPEEVAGFVKGIGALEVVVALGMRGTDGLI